MNANELAKGLSQNQIYGDDYGLFNKRIQNMLRQQADEIEALKKFSRWAYKNLTQTALQYELLGGRSEFDVDELWKLLEEKNERK
jgi:hypothetical protein